jgi:hypothetical protein
MVSLFDRLLTGLLVVVLIVVGGGYALAIGLRLGGLRWTWALLGLPVGMLLRGSGAQWTLGLWLVSLIACRLGSGWQREELLHGGELAQAARARTTVTNAVLESWRALRGQTRSGVVEAGRLLLGCDLQGRAVSIPAGGESGSHTLVVGATGSGKTVSQTWIVCRLIDAGHGAVVIDPKGDRLLRAELQATAARRGKRFLEWTPEGPCAYNPYAHGTDTEVADKALAGETFSEPHYLRQAQRYLGHAVRAMRDAGVKTTSKSLMEHLDPDQLEVTARELPAEHGRVVQAYLDGLGDRQRRELAGIRDRLSILAESEIGCWFDPDHAETIDLRAAVSDRAVVYFRLDADRRALLAGMLASALISDLITLVADLQDQPVATVVSIDEFSAIAAEHVARLFGRARSAGISLILATQELADLKSVGNGALREQVLGNVHSIIAHRQNVPESAHLIAEIAGTRATWVHTQQTQEGLLGLGPSGLGTRKRGREFEIQPDRIKTLAVGEALVVTPGSRAPTIASIYHPRAVDHEH